MKNIMTLAPKPPATANTEHLESAIKEIESGRAVSYTVMLEFGDGKYGFKSSYTPDRHRAAGILLEAAMHKLTDD